MSRSTKVRCTQTAYYSIEKAGTGTWTGEEGFEWFNSPDAAVVRPRVPWVMTKMEVRTMNMLCTPDSIDPDLPINSNHYNWNTFHLPAISRWMFWLMQSDSQVAWTAVDDTPFPDFGFWQDPNEGTEPLNSDQSSNFLLDGSVPHNGWRTDTNHLELSTQQRLNTFTITNNAIPTGNTMGGLTLYDFPNGGYEYRYQVTGPKAPIPQVATWTGELPIDPDDRFYLRYSGDSNPSHNDVGTYYIYGETFMEVKLEGYVGEIARGRTPATQANYGRSEHH